MSAERPILRGWQYYWRVGLPHCRARRMLHILGLDFEKLTYRFNGRDMRLTDVHGKVIKEILAQVRSKTQCD